ncbi:MAG: accessory factor UbiK family protein [Woeseiaceae bacterium]|tara:strand:+ start:2900 stop:3142 length:243 start_codon:yes stop_codon:yes gene_type:complete
MENMEKIFKNIQKKITESIPEDIDALKGDLKQNIQAAIETQIKKLDLVTREELEIQELILKRTREKLEKLEKDIESLDKK